ncbi:MAG: energy-coupling factor transporter transmembrane protein EcfT [Lachnospiraceae bacterium]|jgi:energy-coupling factor transport system permease protein|nr:energy-coupling factor transporter transmembrane protein EcfT [Lachnospiraceae bacterium]
MSFLPAGGYREGCSVLHKMDALGKLICTFLLLGAVIVCHSLPGYGAMAAVLLLLVRFSGLGFGTAFNGVKRMGLFFCVILVMNAVFFEAEQVWWQWWIFRFSREGMIQGMRVVVRVAFAMILGNLLLSTTSPMEIVGAIESLLFPLQWVGIPVRDVAMILGVSIQFIPAFSQEAETLRKAQTARGARFESRKLSEKARSVLPLVVPIFLAAFRRADELALAMEARGYRRTKGRSRFRRRRLSAADGIGILASLLFYAAQAML